MFLNSVKEEPWPMLSNFCAARAWPETAPVSPSPIPLSEVPTLSCAAVDDVFPVWASGLSCGLVLASFSCVVEKGKALSIDFSPLLCYDKTLADARFVVFGAIA
jgi:hypothetical protein